MTKRDGHQPGPQTHAEGAHGVKTHQRLLQQLHSHSNGPATEKVVATEKTNPERHRLAHDRQQHDEAEKNSEKTRLSRDLERGKI